MKFRFVATIMTGLFLGATLARATPFTFTTENPEGFGFIDLETASVSGGIGKATTYLIFKADAPVPLEAKIAGPLGTYAASASELWFECNTRHYSIVRLFFYNAHGDLTGSLDKPILVDQPVPPQTGVEEQFKIVCERAPPRNSISNFNEVETPLRTLIRTTRATMNDPHYKP